MIKINTNLPRGQLRLFGGLLTEHREKLLHAAEGTGDTFALLTWTVFGAAVVGQYIPTFGWSIVLGSLLVVAEGVAGWIVF